MKNFQYYLEAAKTPITVTTVTNVKKLEAGKVDLFKTSYGFRKQDSYDKGVWLWPDGEKVRWFNADYSTEKNNANFHPGNWFPVLTESQSAKFGVYKEQVWNYEKPYKAVGVVDAARKGLQPGRGVAGKTGGKLTWLKKLDQSGKLETKLGTEVGVVKQLNYKTNTVTDAVQTFYGSSLDLLEALGVPKPGIEVTDNIKVQIGNEKFHVTKIKTGGQEVVSTSEWLRWETKIVPHLTVGEGYWLYDSGKWTVVRVEKNGNVVRSTVPVGMSEEGYLLFKVTKK